MNCYSRNPRKLRSGHQLSFALMLVLLLGPVPLLAATVYKSVDENGVVSYSDTAPAQDQQAEVMVIDVQPGADDELAQDQLEAMRETTDRMVADRQQREQHRAEIRKLQAETQSQPQVIEYGAPADNSSIYTGYYPYPVYRPGGGYRPRPTHPIARPPMRPLPPGRPPQGNIISPGHDYPASLIRRGYSPEVRAAFEK
jgi:TolA-binding protein